MHRKVNHKRGRHRIRRNHKENPGQSSDIISDGLSDDCDENRHGSRYREDSYIARDIPDNALSEGEHTRELMMEHETGLTKSSPNLHWGEWEEIEDDSSLPVEDGKLQLEDVSSQRKSSENANEQTSHDFVRDDMEKEELNSSSDQERWREKVKQIIHNSKDLPKESNCEESVGWRERMKDELTDLQSPALVMSFLRSTSYPEGLQRKPQSSWVSLTQNQEAGLTEPLSCKLVAPNSRAHSLTDLPASVQKRRKASLKPEKHKPVVRSDPNALNASSSQLGLVQAVETQLSRAQSLANLGSGSIVVVQNKNIKNIINMSREKLDVHGDELYETRRFPEAFLEPLKCLDLGDWKMLASHLNMDRFIDAIEAKVKNHDHSPVKLLMDKWWQVEGRNADVSVIKQGLEKMERKDVLDELEDVEKDNAIEQWDQ